MAPTQRSLRVLINADENGPKSRRISRKNGLEHPSLGPVNDRLLVVGGKLQKPKETSTRRFLLAVSRPQNTKKLPGKYPANFIVTLRDFMRNLVTLTRSQNYVGIHIWPQILR